MNDRLAGLIAGVIGVGALVALMAPAHPQTITGTAHAVDGDTIDIHGTRIRLFGIDAPEARQTCTGADSRLYPCGAIATVVMRRMLAEDAQVTCQQQDIDRYKRVVARCSNKQGDLGGRMVALGWARDYTRYSKGYYRGHENAARGEKLGIWAGSFVNPEEVRHRR